MIHRIEKYTKTGSAHTYTLTFQLRTCDLDFTSGRTHTFTQHGLPLSAGESIILILLAEGYRKLPQLPPKTARLIIPRNPQRK